MKECISHKAWGQLVIFELPFASVKTSLREKPIIGKCVRRTGSFSFKLNSFSYERFCTRIGFETKVQGSLFPIFVAAKWRYDDNNNLFLSTL